MSANSAAPVAQCRLIRWLSRQNIRPRFVAGTDKRNCRLMSCVYSARSKSRISAERRLNCRLMPTASRVRIVHGHGMGVLRKTIWELLKSSPHVEKYYPAPQNEGGAGATIVELKE